MFKNVCVLLSDTDGSCFGAFIENADWPTEAQRNNPVLSSQTPCNLISICTDSNKLSGEGAMLGTIF